MTIKCEVYYVALYVYDVRALYMLVIFIAKIVQFNKMFFLASTTYLDESESGE